MPAPELTAFANELEKLGFFRDMWEGFMDVFRSDKDKSKRRVDYHFSPKAGPDKWDKLQKNVRSPEFLKQLKKHPDADPKLIQHASALHDLQQGKVVGKEFSERLPGKSYEIKDTARGLACTCPDWRFVGSLNQGYKCKHIKAHEQRQAT